MRSLTVIACLILAACTQLPTEPQTAQAHEESPLQLHAQRTSESTIVLTLRNESRATVGYNLCSSTLERRVAGSWQTVPEEIVCTRELRTLAAGASATFDRHVRPTLAPGEYRFVTQVESPLGGRMATIASNTLTIS